MTTITKKPKLTVVLLAYNAEKFIDKSICSILAQRTNFDFVVLAGNDGSTDGTVQKLLHYQKLFPKLIVPIITKRIPRKVSSDYVNFSHLFSNVKSDYFIVLDPDDYYIDSYKFQKQIDFLEANRDFTICGHNYYYEFENGSRREAYDPIDVKNNYPMICNNFNELIRGGYTPYMQTATVMYRNIFKDNMKVKNLFYKSEYSADWIRTLMHGQYGKSYFMNELMSVYTISQSGVWSSMSDVQRAYHYVNFYRYHKKNTFEKIYVATLDRIIATKLEELLKICRKERKYLIYIKYFFIWVAYKLKNVFTLST